MKVRDVIGLIEAAAPPRTQEDWDNSGLQTGSPDAEVTGVLLSLDATPAVVNEALAKGCNLLITHHPLLFGKIRSLSDSDETGACVREALLGGLSVYSSHTPLDRMRGGVSWRMASMLGLTGIRALEAGADALGYGAIGQWERPRPLSEALAAAREAFGVNNLRYRAPDDVRPVRTVALCGGAGAFLIKEARRQGADLYLTGDLKYHDWRAGGARLALADIGHFESEQCTKQIFFDLLSEKIPNFAIHFSEQDTNPIQIFT